MQTFELRKNPPFFVRTTNRAADAPLAPHTLAPPQYARARQRAEARGRRESKRDASAFFFVLVVVDLDFVLQNRRTTRARDSTFRMLCVDCEIEQRALTLFGLRRLRLTLAHNLVELPQRVRK